MLGGDRTHPTEDHPFGEVPWTLQILVLSRLLPRFPLGTQKSGKLPPQGTPKWPQTHGIYSVGATLGHFGGSWIIRFVSVCFLGAYFFKFPVTFADFGGKLVPKMEWSFHPHELQVASFLDKAPTSGHSGPWRGRGSKN